jgi:tetratricopeptide (TPR) repeat protein
MKLVLTSLAVAFFSTIAMGQQIKLTGRLISNEGKPVPNVRVGIGEEQSKPSDKNGRFTIGLPSTSRAGERVVITVNNTLWLINEPLDGEWTIPAFDAKNPPTLELIVAERSSKGLWNDGRIEKELTRKSRDHQELLKKYGSTPEVLDDVFQKWAATQNNLGNTLREQSTRVDGPEAVRLLAQAESAYRRALLVFTRESKPQEWATTQHGLGFVLQEQGVRANGPGAIRLIDEGVAAYRQALSVRTREQLPLEWAMTQNDLGNALQAQGTRAEGAEARRLLGEAAAAYGQALLVFTRELMPRQWAMTQHNLGSALQEQGARTKEPEARRLFGEAVAAYREALLVWTREQRPQQWAMAQMNLARAYFNLQEWASAADCYQNLLADERLDAKIKIPVRALEIAALIALNRSAEVAGKLKNLIAAVESQPADFRVQWGSAGMQQSIAQGQQFGAKTAWLLQLFAAMEGENRDAIIKRVTAAAASFGN